MSESLGRSTWNSLWVAFWVYLVGGCILFQFVASANFYYLLNVKGSQIGPIILMMVGQLFAALHALSALYFVWKASRRSSALVRVTSRAIAVLYLSTIFVGSILWGYILIFMEFP
jgi:hypothetical protein